MNEKRSGFFKKYHSLPKDLTSFTNELIANPRMGMLIKENTYKTRLSVKSKGKGKSGGMRIITYVHVQIQSTKEGITEVYLLTIYDKSDFATIADKYLNTLIGEIEKELTKSDLGIDQKGVGQTETDDSEE